MSKINLENYQAYFLDLLEGRLSSADEQELDVFLNEHPHLREELNDVEITSIGDFETETDTFDKSSLKRVAATLEEEAFLYTEGLLSAEEQAIIESRQEENNDLQKEILRFKQVKLVPEEGFDLSLLKSGLIRSHAEFSDEELIAYYEGGLTTERKQQIFEMSQKDQDLMNVLNLYSQVKFTPDNAVVFPDKESLKKESKLVYLFSVKNVMWSAAAAVALLIGLFLFFETGENKETHVLANKTQEKKDIYVPNHSEALNDSAVKTTVADNSSESKVNSERPVQEKVNNKKNQTNLPQESVQEVPENKQLLANYSIDSSSHNNNSLAVSNNPILVSQNYISSLASDGDSEEDDFRDDILVKDDNSLFSESDKKKNLLVRAAGFVAKGLHKVGNKKSGAQEIYNEVTQRSEYVVTIGKFSCSEVTASK